METFVKAFFVDQDFETVWKLFSPELQKKSIGDKGSKEDFLAGMKEAVSKPDEEMDEIRKGLKDKEKFDQFVEEMLKEADEENSLVEIDGKWYINKLD